MLHISFTHTPYILRIFFVYHSPLVSKVGALERPLHPHEAQLVVDVGEPRDVRGARHAPAPIRDEAHDVRALGGDRVAFVQDLFLFVFMLR